MDKKITDKLKLHGSFIKVTTQAPVNKSGVKTSTSRIGSSQKAALNRKGNQLFNDKKIEEARRVFLTTGYSDGLTRVGDHYKSQNRMLDALRMYWIAPDKKKSTPLIEQLAGIIQSYIKEDLKEDITETDEQDQYRDQSYD